MAHCCRMFHFSMFSSLFLKKYKQNICQYDNLGSNYFPGRLSFSIVGERQRSLILTQQEIFSLKLLDMHFIQNIYLNNLMPRELYFF